MASALAGLTVIVMHKGKTMSPHLLISTSLTLFYPHSAIAVTVWLKHTWIYYACDEYWQDITDTWRAHTKEDLLQDIFLSTGLDSFQTRGHDRDPPGFPGCRVLSRAIHVTHVLKVDIVDRQNTTYIIYHRVPALLNQ